MGLVQVETISNHIKSNTYSHNIFTLYIVYDWVNNIMKISQLADCKRLRKF